MPRPTSLALLASAFAGLASASMPECEVTTHRGDSTEVTSLTLDRQLSQQTTSSATECANLCLDNESCASFTLDVLSEDPTCKLFGDATKSPSLRTTTSGSAPVVVGSCRGADSADDMPTLLGLDYFEKGVNAINDTVNRTKNIRLPVYSYHFTQGKSYYNPFTQVAYKVPDELSMTVNEAGFEQIDTLYSDDYSASVTETTKRYSWQVGVQINFGNVGAGVTYSDNKQWYNFNLEEREKMNYVSHSKMWWKFWEIMAYPMEVLGANAVDPLFKSFLDSLPPTISGPNDTAKYNLLLDNWGTHYVTWANYGGLLNLDIFTNGSFARSQTQEWNSDQHSLAFHFHLFDIDPSAQIAGFTNKSQIHVNQSYVNSSRVTLYYEGGDPTLMDESSLRPWLNTLQKNPHWLNVTYAPLSKLPFLSPQVAETLDKYILKYLAEASGNTSVAEN